MYSVNETIEAKFLLLHPTTGLPVTGATVVSTLYDETDTIHSYPTVTEIGNGLYTASFVPDTAGEWTIIFGCSTPVQSGGLTFPVGLGICKDVEDKVDIVDANVDSVLADTNELQTDWTNGGRLDLLLDGVKTKTDLIGASVAPSNEYDTEMARITGNVALEATLTAIKGSGWSTQTLKAIYDSIGGLNDITAASVWAVSTRSLTDKSDFTLSTTGIDAIRKSVCLTGDTANSIGKILYDFSNVRLSATRCGYIDYLASGTYGLSALKTLIDTVDTVVDSIKAKTDLIGASVATAGEYTSALGVIDGYFDVTTADSTSDATIRDVVGRKTDTANTTVGTTSSLMRYTKGILGLLTNGTYGLSALETLVDDLEGRLTATRAGYLDNINNANLATLPAISSTRIGYLDNLSGGAVALNSTVAKEATLTHATYGLDKIKTETESLISKVDTVDSIVDLIKIETDKLANATYGLSAIKTAINAIPTTAMRGTDNAALASVWTSTRGGYIDYLANGTYGLSALNTDLDSVISYLSDGTYGLNALKTLVDDLETDIATVDSVVDTIQNDTDKMDSLEALIAAVMDLYRVGGTVTTDGTEQTVYISDNPSGLIKPMRFLIDTTNHTSDETVVLKFYYRIKSGGSYVVFSSATLTGAQSPLGVSYELYPNAWGYKVTIEKTGGTNRAYDWEIFGGN